MTDKTKISTSVSLSPELHAEAKAHAEAHHMPMAVLLRQALVSYLNADIEGGLDRLRAEVARLGDEVARLRSQVRNDN